jgi:hypothetical protein
VEQSNSSILYSPRRDTTPEAELNALATVYKYVLDCHAKKAAEPAPELDGRDDVKESHGYVASNDHSR